MSGVIRFDRDRLMEELCQFFERETGINTGDPRSMPIEMRVAVRGVRPTGSRNAPTRRVA